MEFNYGLFAGQKVFSDAEEILSILSQAFNETFLLRRIKEGDVMNQIMFIHKTKPFSVQ